MHRHSLHLALAALIVVALPAAATTLTWYTDRAAWEGAVGNTFSLIDFQSATPGSYGTSAGVTIDGVQFTGNNEADQWYLYVSDNDPLNQNLYAAGGLTKAYSSAQFANAATYKAAGMDVTATSAAIFYAKVNVDNVWNPVAPENEWAVPPNTTGFIGFISDEGVNQIWVRSNTYYNLDNFVFSNGSEQLPYPEETPDLDTLILCGTGLGILSFLMRWRKRAKA